MLGEEKDTPEYKAKRWRFWGTMLSIGIGLTLGRVFGWWIGAVFLGIAVVAILVLRARR